ncbi:MAG: phosphatidate cytidylyltransferase [Defluviimonas sp.]|uniref:phosphatidate cytidylyltransferase n=1 Tax=Albidovulum sp. TaxID=1872424 RepID=UPI001DBB4116|nr:phosphatidate cytidylyltransferase [Paracoccaceae bacterium]MCC0063907.1 phosphatidate cytidylyltransferase [Defluviimonas sp.]
MNGLRKWDDLAPRVLSGAAMAAVGLGLLWAGGVWFAALAVLAAALMIWELAVMTGQGVPGQGVPGQGVPGRGVPGQGVPGRGVPGRGAEAKVLAGIAAVALALALYMQHPFYMPLLALPCLAGSLSSGRRNRLDYAVYSAMIMLASYGLVAFREGYGTLWLLWLVLVVVVTDIAGYFAGRVIGGPKFWPAISPKKTWSGTVAGWIAAALIGWAFLAFTTAGRDLVWISGLLAFFSQMGDIFESSVKRRAGVKDSSHLIPGHGGLMDRFDGLLGAALFMLFVAVVLPVPVPIVR